MKDIGFTSEGNRLIEMNETEYMEFSALSRAVEGSSMPFPLERNQYTFRTDFDFTKTFEVILAWYHCKFRLNEMQAILTEMKDSLEKVDNG